MHHLRLNVRITMLAVAVAAVLLAGGLAPAPRQAEASFPDVNGIICGFLHDLTLEPIGGTLTPIPFSGTTLARIDHGPGTAIKVTAVAYTDPTGTLTMPNCKTPQAPMPSGVVVPNTLVEVLPSVLATYDSGTNVIGGTNCQSDFTFGGFNMPGGTDVTLALTLSKNEPTVQSSGSFTFENKWLDAACSVPSLGPPQLGTIVVQFDALYMAGPTIGTAVDSSNWDKDGCSDWQELNPSKKEARGHDPFKSADCGGVGGIAELAEAAGTPLAAPDSSGASAGLIAGVLAAVAAGVVALGGAAWYAKRRP